MEQFELLKAIVFNYRADISVPMCFNCRSKRFMLTSFRKSATEELLLYVKTHDPFDPVGSIELFIDEMLSYSTEYPEMDLMFTVYSYTAAEILDILKAAI